MHPATHMASMAATLGGLLATSVWLWSECRSDAVRTTFAESFPWLSARVWLLPVRLFLLPYRSVICRLPSGSGWKR